MSTVQSFRFSDQERTLASQLSTLLEDNPVVEAELKISGISSLVLPKTALNLLEHILSEMAKGNEITLAAPEKELTTQEVAKLLNVSRPFVVKLLKNKQLPYRKVGSHRRVHLRDVLSFKDKMRQESDESMQALADQAQDLNLGY
jgi:excisionase family DNA binding protein